jgi:hypothetical protein
MKKSHTKINNQLITYLNKLCDFAQENMDGFLWLSHVIDYDSPKKGWKVICVFDTQEQAEMALQKGWKTLVLERVAKNVQSINSFFTKTELHIEFRHK